MNPKHWNKEAISGMKRIQTPNQFTAHENNSTKKNQETIINGIPEGYHRDLPKKRRMNQG